MKRRLIGGLVAALAALTVMAVPAQSAPGSDTKFACADVIGYPNNDSQLPEYNGTTGDLSVSVQLGAPACPNKYTYKLFYTGTHQAVSDYRLATGVRTVVGTTSGDQVTFRATNVNPADPGAQLSKCDGIDQTGCVFFWVETISTKDGTVADYGPDLRSDGSQPAECQADPFATTAGDLRCDVGQLPMH